MRSLTGVIVGGVVASLVFLVGAIVSFLIIYGIPLGASPGPPGPGYFALNLGFAILASLSGGWISARIARVRSRANAAVLALGLAVVVLWGFTKPASQWPGWYPPVLAVIAAAGALCGGLMARDGTERRRDRMEEEE